MGALQHEALGQLGHFYLARTGHYYLALTLSVDTIGSYVKSWAAGPIMWPLNGRLLPITRQTSSPAMSKLFEFAMP